MYQFIMVTIIMIIMVDNNGTTATASEVSQKLSSSTPQVRRSSKANGSSITLPYMPTQQPSFLANVTTFSRHSPEQVVQSTSSSYWSASMIRWKQKSSPSLAQYTLIPVRLAHLAYWASGPLQRGLQKVLWGRWTLSKSLVL